MKILLFNDNPVVRKLVALSAQKTKDELSVVWSLDEIGESDYDLLIIDDAMYSDELFLSLKEVITYKNTLLMATRGQPVPQKFDNIINKPFLPTDLVEMFVQIEKKISSSPTEEGIPSPVSASDEAEEAIHAINLEETLPEFSSDEDVLNLEDIEAFDLGDLESEIDLTGDDLESLEDTETMGETAILDKEEVQEVQNLLDDAESDDWNLEENIEIKPIEEAMSVHEDELNDLDEEDELFDDIGLNELMTDEDTSESDDEIGLPSSEDEEEFAFDDETMLEAPALSDENLLEEELISQDTIGDNLQYEEEDELVLDDEELGNLESQIENAVNTLEPEMLESELELGDLELELDDSLMNDLELPTLEGDEIESDDGDPFGSLDEKALKQAIGEEVKEEVEEAEPEELFDEELFEPMEEEPITPIPVQSDGEIKPAHAEGVEALQALLKALSNEEVAKSLKGLNISININFGNEQ